MDENYERLRQNAQVRRYSGGISGGRLGGTAELVPDKKGRYGAEQLERFFQDLFYEPDWRSEAEVAAAFYDGDQLSRETLRKMQQYGILPVVMNHSAKIIDAIGGMEELVRKDIRVVSKDDYSYEPSLAVNSDLKEAFKQTNYHYHVGRQFIECTVVGLSWLEVSRNIDPFKYRYQTPQVPWREMFSDYRARQQNYEDARYHIRRRWYDVDDLLPVFRTKEQQKIIKDGTRNNGAQVGNFFSIFENSYHDFAGSLSSNLNSEYRWTLEEDEHNITDRPRIGLIEVLYYVPKYVETITLRNGAVAEIDSKDLSPLEKELLLSGQGEYRQGVTKEWRQAYFIGAERLVDHALAFNSPHYFPMVCFRKNGSGAPYGVMKRMISPQENINAKWIRISYDLSSHKYFVDEDAVDDHDQTKKELNKTNAYVILNSDRRGERGIDERVGTETTRFSHLMLGESQAGIHDVSGISREFIGQVQSAGQSGRANMTMIEQSAQVLGPLMGNYSHSKLASSGRLVKMIVHDTMMQMNLERNVNVKGVNKKIVLNARGRDGRMTNDLMLAMLEHELEKVPMSDTYRQQKFQQLVEIVKSLPKEIQPLMADLIVLAAQVAEGEEILDRIREYTGYGPPPKDPQARAELEQRQVEQQQKQEEAEALDKALAETELALQQAKAALEQAKAQKTAGADTEYTDAKTIAEMAKVEAQLDEQARKRVESAATMLEKATRLRQAKSNDVKSAAKK